MLDYNFLLKKYCSEYDCYCIGNSYEGISWGSELSKKPSEDQFKEWWKECESEFNEIKAEQIKIKNARKLEYPQIEEMVVALWEKIMNSNDAKATELQIKRILVQEKYQTFIPGDPEENS